MDGIARPPSDTVCSLVEKGEKCLEVTIYLEIIEKHIKPYMISIKGILVWTLRTSK
jgi:hypothetical protein